MSKRLFSSILTLLFALCLWTVGMAQSQSKRVDNLEKLAFRMVNDSLTENRIAYSDSLKNALIEMLQSAKGATNSFDELQSIAVTSSLDDQFRIFSWQVYISNNEYKHEGILQYLTGDQSIVVFDDKSDDIYRPANKELGSDQWFGALYYNIVPFKAKKATQYLLFGFDGATDAENCKIVDVLTIKKDGSLVFGAPIFEFSMAGVEQTYHRYFHQYDQNAKAVLRYDPTLEMIIFDHLIPWQSKEVGGKLTYVPDGSYQGYALKKGKWQMVDKIFHHVSASPASPENPTGKKVVENLPKN